MKKVFRYFILFYKKYLSIFSHGSCRYYPTCSSYALWQFDNNTFFKAIYFTIMRILRCNQLFDGGIDYPTVKFKPNKIHHKKIKVVYWLVPIGDEKFKVIKNRDWEIRE